MGGQLVLKRARSRSLQRCPQMEKPRQNASISKHADETRGNRIDTEPRDSTEAFLGQLRLGRRGSTIRPLLWLILAMLIGVGLLLGGPLEGRLGRFGVVGALIAALAIGVTGLSVLELLGGSSQRAGSYGLVHETVGGIASFLCGWSLTAGAALLAASLIRAAATTIAVWLGVPGVSAPIAFGMLILLLISLVLPFDRRRRLRNVLVVAGGASLVVLLVGAGARSGWTWQATARTPDAGDLWREAARLFVLYFGFDVVLAARRQLRRDAPTMGRAIGGSIGVGVVVFALPLLLSAGLVADQGQAPIWQVLSSANVVAPPLAPVAVSLILLLSAHALLSTTARGVYDMSRAGALPAGLRRLRRPLIVPPLVHMVSGATTGVLLLLAGEFALLDLAAAFVLVVALLVNVAAIVSRRVETERRRLLLLPFFPLVPAIAITAIASLMLNLPGRTQLVGLGWLTVGVVIYVAYSRQMQVAAQEGVTLFGPDQRIEKAEESYRILVPLAPGERRDFLLSMAVGLAKQLGGDVLPLQVIPVPDPLAMEEGRRLARERNTMFRWSTRLASEAGVPVFPITRLARTVQEGIVDTAIEESCDLLLLPWSMAGEADTGQMGGVLDPVISQSPCDTAVLVYHPDATANGQSDPEGEFPRSPAIRSILVPTAGGPHAPLATGLALVLARQYRAKVTAVYVSPKDSSRAEIEAGEARIQETIETMRQKAALALHREESDQQLGTAAVESRIILADDVVEGIAEASKQVDLAIIGASEESMIDQVLFGNLPRRIAGACQSPVIMVRRYRGLPRFWLRRIWDSVSAAFPTLEADQQIDLYKRVRRGARPDVDFFVMMGLAATIGALGLLLNSGAVIIGAMLVAPLFTPILAFSLAIATGNTSLLRLAFESTLQGVFLSIGLALLIGALAPLPPDVAGLPEIASRIQPNLLDLAVALAAGAAGAYAIARQDVAAALPGVAIAAALVPPLAVVGIGLAAGRFAIAGGAALLVTTNLTAISLSGAITLLLLGFRPAARGERRAQLRTGLVATVLLLILISIPLATVLIRTVRRTTLEQQVHGALRAQVSQSSGMELTQVSLDDSGETLLVTATIYLEDPAERPDGAGWSQAIAEQIDRDVTLRLVAVPVMEFQTDIR
jgi:uncharacterized hydrophobic protein (TIGR00271 family)